MTRPVSPREHYGAELRNLADVIKRTAVDKRIGKEQLEKIRWLAGELTNELIKAQSTELPPK